MNEEVKAARLTGERLKDAEMPSANLGVLFRRAAQAAQDAEVREAVEFFAAMDNDCVDRPDEVKRQADVLCRAVQAPRLTGERLEAVRDCAEMFEDQEWPQYAQKLRTAFPELADGN